jgi:hypothetical protein
MIKKVNFIKKDISEEEITSVVLLFIVSETLNNKQNNCCNKLLNVINFINCNNITIKYNTNILQKNVCIYLYKINEVIGTFEINDFGNKNSMSISIDDDINYGFYRGKGLSRLMVTSMIYLLKYEIKKFSNLILNPGFLLHIDTDASEGFWKKIGMTDNRFYLRRDIGYEMDITLRQLEKWSLGTTYLFNF